MRVDYRKVFPAGQRAMAELERAVRSAALEPELIELVRIRASQVNGCTYCLDGLDLPGRPGPAGSA